MQTEQKQVSTVPEKPPQADSDESKLKSGRGGKREGAGRPPGVKRIFRGLTRETIAEAATRVDWGEVLLKLTKEQE